MGPRTLEDFGGPGIPKDPAAQSAHPSRAGRVDAPAERPMMRNGTSCLPKQQRPPAGGKRCLAEPSDRDEEQTLHRDLMTAPGEPRRASAFRTRSARPSRRLRPPSTLACRFRVARMVNASKKKTRETASFLCITRAALHKAPTTFPPIYPQAGDCLGISKRCPRGRLAGLCPGGPERVGRAPLAPAGGGLRPRVFCPRAGRQRRARVDVAGSGD